MSRATNYRKPRAVRPPHPAVLSAAGARPANAGIRHRSLGGQGRRPAVLKIRSGRLKPVGEHGADPQEGSHLLAWPDELERSAQLRPGQEPGSAVGQPRDACPHPSPGAGAGATGAAGGTPHQAPDDAYARPGQRAGRGQRSPRQAPRRLRARVRRDLEPRQAPDDDRTREGLLPPPGGVLRHRPADPWRHRGVRRVARRFDAERGPHPGPVSGCRIASCTSSTPSAG